MGQARELETLLWMMTRTEAYVHQKSGSQPSTWHQNEADALLTAGRTFVGAFIILYTL